MLPYSSTVRIRHGKCEFFQWKYRPRSGWWSVNIITVAGRTNRSAELGAYHLNMGGGRIDVAKICSNG